MARIDELIASGLRALPEKPADSASQAGKKRYSELLSEKMALAFAEELRNRGLEGARPGGSGVAGESGAERRMSGGIGAKRVDVTWATEESGLMCAISIKTINFKDSRSQNYQKNLANRRGDMLFEAVTLHRRFPYAVLAGFLFLDAGAEADRTARRESTLDNAHARFRLFTGRDDPAGRDEQYERMYLVMLDTERSTRPVRAYEAGTPGKAVSFERVFDEVVELVAERNPDLYRCKEGSLSKS